MSMAMVSGHICLRGGGFKVSPRQLLINNGDLTLGCHKSWGWFQGLSPGRFFFDYDLDGI